MESYGGAVIEWQPVIDSLSQSVIVLAIILTTMDNKQLYFFSRILNRINLFLDQREKCEIF